MSFKKKKKDGQTVVLGLLFSQSERLLTLRPCQPPEGYHKEGGPGFALRDVYTAQEGVNPAESGILLHSGATVTKAGALEMSPDTVFFPSGPQRNNQTWYCGENVDLGGQIPCPFSRLPPTSWCGGGGGPSLEPFLGWGWGVFPVGR